MTPTDTVHTDPDANAIVEYLLEENRLALFSGDFARFEPNFGLPYTLETFEGREVVTTRAALERLFLNSVSYYKETGVTDLVRRPLHSAFRDETTLTTLYETQLIHFDRVFSVNPMSSIPRPSCRMAAGAASVVNTPSRIPRSMGGRCWISGDPASPPPTAI
jgi:hypothetical protein